MDWQQTISLLIVIVAAALLLRQQLRRIMHKAPDSCDQCPAGRKASNPAA